MAKKTFSVTTLAATAGQTVDATTTAVQIAGTIPPGTVLAVEASHDGTTWSPVSTANELGMFGSYPIVAPIAIPGGWSVRIVPRGSIAPNAAVVIE